MCMYVCTMGNPHIQSTRVKLRWDAMGTYYTWPRTPTSSIDFTVVHGNVGPYIHMYHLLLLLLMLPWKITTILHGTILEIKSTPLQFSLSNYTRFSLVSLSLSLRNRLTNYPSKHSKTK